ncbi:Zinc finger, RAN-binding domain containing 2 [Seminavis robusta]|uniref:Zinc finger, RAN-binding domain containing 2 n=1 Tax=Seminavis robusta TaxID=568900 RepID=A0A9N8HMG9_9STRA|nr:Zinc finger, RAN-binding domain containing 2 [Seminavis robusta]|eukprot:Sro905_g218460.1 Zinc finger, RAN-binding domain containing 2 (438) ;mRNA; r:3957-5674
MGVCFSCCGPGHDKKTEAPILYTVIYNSESHWSILTQRLGSAWPAVFPFCVFNVAVVLLLSYINADGPIVYISGQGHKFIRFVVAFLFVSRVTMALQRFNEARGHLGQLYRESRELVQYLCTLTAKYQDEKSREYRAELTYRSMLFLRTAVGILDYHTTGLPNWKVPELNGVELDYVLNNLLYHPQNAHYAMLPRCEFEENIRVPLLIGLLLRKSIIEHTKRLPKPLAMPEENKLFAAVDSCVTAYSGLRKFKSTPVPFPLIQMARTFLFLYIFTVPLVFVKDESSIYAHCFAIFLMTYGFMGLEMIAIALDNPFGDDPIDFKSLALAHTAFEDTYLTVLDIDGREWADFLRYRMNDNVGDRLNTEQTWLLSSQDRFANLMVGNTLYKRESEAAQAHALVLDAQIRLAREAEEKKKKEKGFFHFRNPMAKKSPRNAS